MSRAARTRSRIIVNMQLKASSLCYLNDISNFNSTENLSSDSSNWRDSYAINPAILGRGHFSKVYKAKCSVTGKHVAIKVIRRRRTGIDRIDEIMNEIEIMQTVNKSGNSGFIQLVKSHVSVMEIAVLMEFAAGGSIYNVIRESETGLPEAYTRIILSKIISALSIMHVLNIVHLDIKADNMLLRHPYPSTDVAIADFGLARKLSKTSVYKEIIGTPDYIAPEIANYDNISTKSDMWSIGVLTYFTLTNISPFCGDTKEQTLSKVTKAQYDFLGELQNENMQMARDFISLLLVKPPEKRLSPEECLNHDFLSSVALVECPQPSCVDKSNQPSNVTPDSDLPPQVRDNANYKFRALVTSQYDIESSFDNSVLLDERNDMLKYNSVNCLINPESSSSSVSCHINEDQNHSSHVTEDDNIHDNPEKLNERHQNLKEVVMSPQEELNNNVFSANKDLNNNLSFDEQVIDMKNENIEEVERDSKLETPKVDMEYMDKKDMSNTSLHENMSSSCETTTNNEISSDSNTESYSEVVSPTTKFHIINRVGKENCEILDSEINIDYHNKSFSKTIVRDSRRNSRKTLDSSLLQTSSFKHSREDLLDPNYGIMYHNEDFRSHWRPDYEDSRSRNYSTMHLNTGKSNIKRRHLSKSVKKDFDKPTDTLNRRSQIITSSSFMEQNSNDISKSHPVLTETSNGSKLTKFWPRFQNPFKEKKHKSEKKSSNCIIS